MRERRAALLADRSLRGPAFSHAYTALLDEWLVSLAPDADRYAIIGIGGYGRRELAPASDLDVLLVHSRSGDIKEIAERLWYPIWDAGIRLDHSVRTVKEALAVADQDLRAALGLLDLRFVSGDEAMADDLAGRLRDQWRKHVKRWLPLIEADTALRHERSGAVAFMLEPDLKESEGGLRDATIVRALSTAVPVFEPTPQSVAAVAQLLDLRIVLQRITGRHDDRLLLDDQDEVARVAGYANADDLMREVAAIGRTISWQLTDARRAVSSTLQGPRGRSGGADALLAPGVVLRDGEVTLLADADPAHDPALLPRVAAMAAERAKPIARSTLSRLAAGAPVLEETWTAEQRDLLISLLGSGDELVDVFDTLDHFDLFTRIFPEWGAVRSRPQRNAFHRYTVDRHLVECAVQASHHTRDVARPDLLLVAALFHDIGKGSPGDHSDAGVVLIRTIASRMAFDPADVDRLVDLVRLHLLIPAVATSRDLADPATARMVAEQVGTSEQLDLLQALTIADSIATGPAAWSEWKASLVHRLVETVRAALAGVEPPRQPLEPASDAALVARANGDLVVEGTDRHLVVVAPDQARLFSRVVGILALQKLDVRGGRARSTDDGVAISEWDIASPFGDEPNWVRFESDLRAALRGRVAIDARLAERGGRSLRPTAASPPETRVLVDNESSPQATIFEVRTADALGVLYRISRAIADLHLDIRHAKVSTMGHEVVDTFYLVDETQQKIDDEALLDELRVAVLHELAGLAASGAVRDR